MTRSAHLLHQGHARRFHTTFRSLYHETFCCLYWGSYVLYVANNSLRFACFRPVSSLQRKLLSSDNRSSRCRLRICLPTNGARYIMISIIFISYILAVAETYHLLYRHISGSTCAPIQSLRCNPRPCSWWSMLRKDSSRTWKAACSVLMSASIQPCLVNGRLAFPMPVLPKVADVFAPLFDDPAGDP